MPDQTGRPRVERAHRRFRMIRYSRNARRSTIAAVGPAEAMLAEGSRYDVANKGWLVAWRRRAPKARHRHRYGFAPRPLRQVAIELARRRFVGKMPIGYNVSTKAPSNASQQPGE